MQKQRSYAPYLIISGLTLMLMAIGQFGQGSVAWADGTYFQTVPTRTPVPSDSGDNNDSSSPSSEITGQVIDASTGAPGAGIIVRLNDIEVRTDSEGKYSLSGLNAGEFTITLVLEGGAIEAQEPVVITVDGQTNTSVDLNYYSNPADAQTAPAPAEASDNTAASDANVSSSDTSADNQPQASEATQSQQPAVRSTEPQRLPTTGGVDPGWLIMFGGGLISLLFGLKLSRLRGQ